MPDDMLSEANPPRPIQPRRNSAWIALAAFVFGLGAAGWLGWRSGADFGQILALPHGRLDARQPAAPAAAVAPGYPAPDAAVLPGRVTALEQRLDRLDLRIEAASSNTARAEALLVAFAVRRVAERGAPLGYLADQLKLRFGDAQPNAVATIVTDAKDLVPLDRLAARLEGLPPQMTATGEESTWRRVTRAFANLFVVRRDRPVQSDADARFDDARMALSEGRIDAAVAIVHNLSNSDDAVSWCAAARRYRDVERALDLIDTTALLEPRQGPVAGANTR